MTYKLSDLSIPLQSHDTNDPLSHPLISHLNSEPEPSPELDQDDHQRPSAGSILRPAVDSNLAFSASFFFFGLLNNVLYVIILSAALDLVPADVPTGVILFADISPSLVVKIAWPYFLKGQIRYPQRILSCSALSFLGMMIIVIFRSVPMRLFGITLASFSSGLGEMTFLQLTTRYGDQPGVSWFASGTGAAGVVGAGLWWLLRHLGIQIGLGLSSILPLCLSFTYFFLLPPPSRLASSTLTDDDRLEGAPEYTALLDQTDPSSTALPASRIPLLKPHLNFSEKLELAKPLLVPYMLPLFAVYFAEYTINTAVAPNLLYPPPPHDSHPIFSLVFKSLRDYYPFWQLTYQTFVFFSRSSMAIFRFPPLPKRLMAVPSMIQVVILMTVLMESSREVVSWWASKEWIYVAIFSLISLEGICGGLAYVSAYYWLGREDQETTEVNEFRIACVGFADTFGILLASLFSSWLQPKLCAIQVTHLGKTLCQDVAAQT